MVFLRGGRWYPFVHYDYFVPFGVIKNKLTKIKFKYFNGNCDYSSWPGWWLLFLYALPHKGLTFWKNYLWTNLSFSYSLKITCILLRQVISLKEMVVLWVKFTIIISWSPICIPLILLSALTRLASTSAAVLYNNLHSWHHWQTHIGVKRSNRRPFILILDSILVYATSEMNEFVSISELMQSKKDKTTPRILQKDFYSVYLTQQLHIFYHLLYWPGLHLGFESIVCFFSALSVLEPTSWTRHFV